MVQLFLLAWFSPLSIRAGNIIISSVAVSLVTVAAESRGADAITHSYPNQLGKSSGGGNNETTSAIDSLTLLIPLSGVDHRGSLLGSLSELSVPLEDSSQVYLLPSLLFFLFILVLLI